MKQDTCDLRRLEAFLDGSLSDQEENDLNAHLSHCPTCARELEQKAAQPSRWNDVKSHLSNFSDPTTARALQITGADQVPLSVKQVVDRLDPTDDPNSLGRIGGYEVTGVVGHGAMGVVLKAVDRTLDRVVALKVMNPTLAACGTARQRFAREAKAAAGVLHPNVIAIHSVSTDHALPYLVMPYIAGVSLQQRLDQQGPLTLPETLRIGNQVAAGLAAAHQKGLIHRDIKPSNIMLDSGVETAVITDFGLARTIDDATMTQSGAITGTPEFMSPEQARGDAIDGGSDVFSLASVLYALCCGQSPFRAKTSFGVLRKITDQSPTPIREINPDVPVWFCNLVEQMHAKLPEDRPTSAEVRDLLENCLAHVYQPDQIPMPQKLSKPHRSRFNSFSKPFLIGGITVMTLSALAILLIAMQPGDTIPPGKAEPVGSSVATVSSVEPTVFQSLNLEFPNPDERGKLIVDINRGFIEVTGHDESDVVIEVLTPPEFEKSQLDDGELKPVFSPKYDLDKDSKKNSIKLDTYNQDYALNLRIKVPVETDLDLDNYYDGYLVVKNVSGLIRTHSQHSDISLLDIAGSASAYTRNGHLNIRFLKVSDDAKLDFETYNGSINLTLPESISASTAISAGIGTYLTAFKIEPIEDDERPEIILAKVKGNVSEYRFGKINGGGIPIRIECEKGTVKLRKPRQPLP